MLRKGKEQCNGDDSKQLDVIISESRVWQCDVQTQSLLLRGGKQEEKRARKGMMGALPGQQPLDQNYSSRQAAGSRGGILSLYLSILSEKAQISAGFQD